MSVCCLLFLWPTRGWRSIGDFVLAVLLLREALELFDDTFRFFSGVKKTNGAYLTVGPNLVYVKLFHRILEWFQLDASREKYPITVKHVKLRTAD